MATIICKRNKFNVVYSYYDEAGKRHQKWEAFFDNAGSKAAQIGNRIQTAARLVHHSDLQHAQ